MNKVTYRLMIKILINKMSLIKKDPMITEIIPRGSRQTQ